MHRDLNLGPHESQTTALSIQPSEQSLILLFLLGYIEYGTGQCHMVLFGMMSNGVIWFGVKWCQVSVAILESLTPSPIHHQFRGAQQLQLFNIHDSLSQRQTFSVPAGVFFC